ncbi:hypothetical protein [Nannocystis pusilla]|uniref:hypothetical protein n=1 Tax=Nannocystis pusilla TaxID=889268 RepID=UPI003B7BBC1F
MQSVNVNVSFDQQVAGIANPSLPTPDKMIEYAIGFPSIPVTAPVVLGYQYEGYEHLAEITTSFEPIAKNRRYFIGDKAVGGLTAKEAQVEALDNQLLWLQDTYRFYGGYSDSRVDQVKAKSGQELSAIRSQKSAYAQDPIQSFTEPPLPSLNEGTPELSLTWGTSEQKGSTGGTHTTTCRLPSTTSKAHAHHRDPDEDGRSRRQAHHDLLRSERGHSLSHGGAAARKTDPSGSSPEIRHPGHGPIQQKDGQDEFLPQQRPERDRGGNSGDKDFTLEPPSNSFVLGFRGGVAPSTTPSSSSTPNSTRPSGPNNQPRPANASAPPFRTAVLGAREGRVPSIGREGIMRGPCLPIVCCA